MRAERTRQRLDQEHHWHRQRLLEQREAQPAARAAQHRADLVLGADEERPLGAALRRSMKYLPARIEAGLGAFGMEITSRRTKRSCWTLSAADWRKLSRAATGVEVALKKKRD
ncbi:MAG: hypothetical protein U0610_29440 [bacterium]